MLALAIPILSWSQSNVAPPPITQIFVFLADPQLGVAGAVVQGDPNAGGTILYFDEIVPAGSTAMSARLLDAEGRTIAISGHSMDSTWLATPEFGTAYDQNAATESLTLAAALRNGIASALPAGFAQEGAAIAGLADGASAQPAGTSALVADFAVANAVTIQDNAQLAAQYEATDVANLAPTRDSLGNLNITYYGTTALRTFVYHLNDIDVDTGQTGITEMSAQLFGFDGYPVATQFGGDDIPINFNINNMFLATLPASYDPILHLQAVGQAVRAAALLGRNPSIATSDEVGALTGLALDLRTNDLRATSNAVDTSTSTNNAALFQQVGVWRRTLVSFKIPLPPPPAVPVYWYTVTGEHSGTVIRNWKQWACGPQGRDQCVYHYNPTVFCNHGTCPRTGDMTLKDKWVSPARAAFKHVPEVNAPAGGFPTQKAQGKHSCYKTNYDISSGWLCWWSTGQLVCNTTNSLGQHTGGHNCNDDSWTQIEAVRGLPFKLDNVNADGSNNDGRKCEDADSDDNAPSSQNPGS
jgi:hypothetical protein